MHIFVQTPNQIDYNISTYRTGAYNFEVSTESAEFANITAEAFAESIQLNNLNNIVSFKTDFGLEFSHEGYTATVRLPIIFGGHVQGLRAAHHRRPGAGAQRGHLLPHRRRQRHLGLPVAEGHHSQGFGLRTPPNFHTFFSSLPLRTDVQT